MYILLRRFYSCLWILFVGNLDDIKAQAKANITPTKGIDGMSVSDVNISTTVMKLSGLIFLLLIPILALAQQDPYTESWSDKQIDSIRTELSHTSNDTMRMRLSRSMGLHYQEINRDSSLYFHEQQLALARKLKLKLWEADALDQTGWVLSQLKNYPLSLQNFLDGIKIAESQDCEKNIWNTALFAKDKKPGTARLTVLGFTYNDMSQLYKAIGNREKYLSSLLQALKIGESINNYTMLSIISVNLAAIYLKINKQDSVIFYALQALDYMDKSRYYTYKGPAYTIIGNVYLKMNNVTLAKEYFEKSVFENQKQHNRTGVPYAYLSIANFFEVIGQPDSSVYYTKKALIDYNYLGLATDIKDCYASLFSYYKLIGNNDSAFYYIQLHKVLNDSLIEVEKGKVNEYQNVGFNEKIKMQELQNEQTRRENSIRTYSLLAGIGVFMLIAFLLYRNNRTRRKANELLQKQKEEIGIQKKNVEGTLAELKSTQSQLVHAEKMASLGELTAGIAHEIQNPLNFVNNFSDINIELIGEMKDELSADHKKEAIEIAETIQSNLEKITTHGRRADSIVKNMLQHSRKSNGAKEPTDINALADEYLRLAYHGLRAKDKSFNAMFKTDLDPAVGEVDVIPQDIGRVLLNLITNAFHAVTEVDKAKKEIDPDSTYKPVVMVSTKRMIDNKQDLIEIKVSDNGAGIPANIKDKIFQPFFTTKPTGQGTGLGLSLAYDIIKAHNGTIKVNSEENKFTEFIIELPTS